MTKTWPESVTRLIEALGPCGIKLDQPTPMTTLAEYSNQLPKLLLMEGTSSDQGPIGGYESMIDFLTNAWPENDRIPWRLMCLVTIGDSHRPFLIPLEVQSHPFDVLATAETVLAYYEAKEQLPHGFTAAVSSFLMRETQRTGYGSEDMEEHQNLKGQEAVKLFREAIWDVSDVAETPALLQIFDEQNFAYTSHRCHTTGRATRKYCQMMCCPEGPHFNAVMANIFEWKAREVLTWFFVNNVAYEYGIDPKSTTYRNLPRSQMIGALAHLPVLKELPGPNDN